MWIVVNTHNRGGVGEVSNYLTWLWAELKPWVKVWEDDRSFSRSFSQMLEEVNISESSGYGMASRLRQGYILPKYNVWVHFRFFSCETAFSFSTLDRFFFKFSQIALCFSEQYQFSAFQIPAFFRTFLEINFDLFNFQYGIWILKS